MDNASRHNIDSLTAIGRNLLSDHDNAVRAHRSFQRWDRFVADWLDKNYPNTGFSADWSATSTSTLVRGGAYYDDSQDWIIFGDAVQRRLAWLANFGRAIQRARSDSPPNRRATKKSNRIFLVHGRNEAAREKVARFLERLDLEVVVLHEQANKGRTIIEKFTDHSEVSFAVVLLTADDIGSLDTPGAELVPRPRQNVIFEFGYFLGKIGRDRVCALYEDGVDILSDYNGVIYITLDQSDAWRLKLAKEIKEAGISIDLNLAI